VIVSDLETARSVDEGSVVDEDGSAAMASSRKNPRTGKGVTRR
jgi:hypothetical protein